MARQARNTPGGLVYHVLNRAAGRMTLFRTDRDFEAFERIIHQAHERFPIRILAYCVMSNHWHFVVWPHEDDEITNFFRWLAHTHAMRWRVSHRTVGYGPLYQGRFKSFPVQEDEHLLMLCRYVERNPLAAGAVDRAEKWRWSSLGVRSKGTDEQRLVLSEWPVERPRRWEWTVNQPLREFEREAVKTSIKRGRPLGSETWIQKVAIQLKLQHTMRDEGRPSKTKRKN